MTEQLKDLLFRIRQHPGFQDLLGAVETPRLPRYKRSKGLDLTAIGAETVYASGALDQHASWIALLTGQASRETNSEKEKL
jgi:hypothetical protein